MTQPNWNAQPYVPMPPPRGWYPDPVVPGQERWWSGFDWTQATHKAAFSHPASSLGAYTRSRWPGLNRAARFAEISAGVGVLMFFVWFIVATVDASSRGPASVAQLVLLVATAGLVVATIVFGSLGVARSSELGGAALAGWSLGIGIVLALGFAATALGFSRF